MMIKKYDVCVFINILKNPEKAFRKKRKQKNKNKA